MGALLGALAGASGAPAAGIYQWTDAEGRVHFGDRPPPGAAARRLHTPEPGASAEDARRRLDATLARIERAIDLLRDGRAERLGISREALDRHERRGGPYAPQAGETEAEARNPQADGRERPEHRVPVPWPYGGYHRRPLFPPQTSDAFRPRYDHPRGRHHRERSGDGEQRAPRKRHDRVVGGCCGPRTPVPDAD